MPRAQTGKPRNIRIPDELWENTQFKAKVQGADASTVVRELLQGYVGGSVQADFAGAAESLGYPNRLGDIIADSTMRGMPLGVNIAHLAAFGLDA